MSHKKEKEIVVSIIFTGFLISICTIVFLFSSDEWKPAWFFAIGWIGRSVYLKLMQ
jgi:hypothetical protein